MSADASEGSDNEAETTDRPMRRTRSILRRSGSCSSRSSSPGARFAATPPDVCLLDHCEADRRALDSPTWSRRVAVEKAERLLGGFVTLHNVHNSHGLLRDYVVALRERGDEQAALEAEEAFGVILAEARRRAADPRTLPHLRTASVAVVVCAVVGTVAAGAPRRVRVMLGWALLCGFISAVAAGFHGLRGRMIPATAMFATADAFAWGWATSSVCGALPGAVAAVGLTVLVLCRHSVELKEEANSTGWGRCGAFDGLTTACSMERITQDMEEWAVY
eukprot:Hpha_TRINITY_DN33867_c0_g1::TRINITY_DN33867_c0_g1_i1::g.27335::m.27335